MATVHITLCRVSARASTGATMQVPNSVEDGAETLTSSGTSQQSALEADEAGTQFWEVTAIGGDVFVKFGANPTAASGTGYLVPSGQSKPFGVTAASEKVAVIDAA